MRVMELEQGRNDTSALFAGPVAKAVKDVISVAMKGVLQTMKYCMIPYSVARFGPWISW